jgi:hypothetical protein
MTGRTRLRFISLVAGLFAILGLALIVISFRVRRYWSPTPGVLIGVVVTLVSALAVVQLWRASRYAAAAFASAGCAVFGMVYALPWLFPLHHVSSEPPSFLEAHGYYTALILVAVVVVLLTWLAQHSGRRATKVIADI